MASAVTNTPGMVTTGTHADIATRWMSTPVLTAAMSYLSRAAPEVRAPSQAQDRF